MTGITGVSKESIFSDLNNLEIVSTTSKKYNTCFGFTEKEVFTALCEYDLQDHMSEVKRWYDGFHFGGCDSIYNPWSIIGFLGNREFKNYWVNTSSNKFVSSLIQSGSKSFKLDTEALLQGKTFHATLDEEIVFSDLDQNESAVWSLLLAGGYLKAVRCILNERGEGNYTLALTNLEVKNVFESMFLKWFADRRAEYKV